MAAKEALFALLENQQSPIEELIQTALACARLHKLSVKTLSKWIWETYEVDIDSDIDLGTSVESHVRALTILSRERLAVTTMVARKQRTRLVLARFQNLGTLLKTVNVMIMTARRIETMRKERPRL